jgi:hypothetical protein
MSAGIDKLDIDFPNRRELSRNVEEYITKLKKEEEEKFLEKRKELRLFLSKIMRESSKRGQSCAFISKDNNKEFFDLIQADWSFWAAYLFDREISMCIIDEEEPTEIKIWWIDE